MSELPKHPSDEVILAAARIIAARLDDGDVDGQAQDIASCYDHYCDDGYELAKKLDDLCYWNCDFSAAEILDGMSIEVRKLHDEFLKKWATENPQPLLPVGTRVRTLHGNGVISESPYEFSPLLYKVEMDDRRTYFFWLDEVTPL